MSRLDKSQKYDKTSKDNARYGQNLASILWRKACKNLPPEIEEMLVQSVYPENLALAVIPEEQGTPDYTFDHICNAVEKAEDLLIGDQPAKAPVGLQWEKFQVLANDQVDSSEKP